MEYDGPTLRQVRESVNIPLRRVARMAGMSHGHLSKVERDEHGRPITPAILAAYERATGVRLSEGKSAGPLEGPGASGWRRGQLSEVGRRGFTARIAALAAGGPLGELVARMIDNVGRFKAPSQVGAGDVAVLEHAATNLTIADLRFGGGLVEQLARVMLRWAVGLTAATMTTTLHRRLHLAIGHLAHRAAWSAFDADAHDAARNLYAVALDAAMTARDRDLRAHVVADVGAQHNYLGYPEDCLNIISMVEGDQDLAPAVRMVVYGVKARAHAAAGRIDQYRTHLDLVEAHYTQARDQQPPDWQATLLTDAQLLAITGHAAAVMARHTGIDTDHADACRRLNGAVTALDPATHARARALCAARLATVYIEAGQPQEAIGPARQALQTAAEIRSARLTRHLQALQGTANARPDNPELKQLATDIATTLQPKPPPPPEPWLPPANPPSEDILG